MHEWLEIQIRRCAVCGLEKIINWFLGGKLLRLEKALASGGVDDGI